MPARESREGQGPNRAVLVGEPPSGAIASIVEPSLRADPRAREETMPRLDTLSEVVRKVLLSFPCLEAPGAPWTPPPPLSRATVALVTTAGLHLRDDRPFVSDPKGGDSSFRVIPSSARASDIVQSHASIGFDHTAFYRDMNVTLPLDLSLIHI